jgi:hypothetical protein
VQKVLGHETYDIFGEQQLNRNEYIVCVLEGEQVVG